MKLISTLVKNARKAYDILEQVPETSIVLLPEGCFPKREVVATVSKRRRLFVVFNEDPYHEEGRRYNAMIGMEEGTVVWRVRKYFLWEEEKDSVDSPPEPEPIVNIRRMNTAVVICYELSKVAGYGRLFPIGETIAEAKTKILLMPAYWQFNWGMPKQVTNICVKKIPSLIASAFASSNIRHGEAYAMVYSKHEGYHETRERNGWVGAEI